MKIMARSGDVVAGFSGGYALGLDIGGTKLAAGVVRSDGAVASLLTRATGAADGPERVIARLLDLARDAISETDVASAQLAGIGIGCVGPLDSVRGVVQNPPNLPGWLEVPLVARVEEALGLPTRLENDATAATLGEFVYGAGRGCGHMLYLTISTGVGGGAVIDGVLHRGRTGNGGELGHIVVVHGGRRCGCGSRGCLEAYVSGTAIAARARERLAAGSPSSLAALPEVTAADVAAAASAGDGLAAELWEETGDILGSGLAGLVNIFEPEVVVLGGGVTRGGAGLLDRVRESALARAMPAVARDCRIVLAALGDRVGVVGAATAVFVNSSTGLR